MGIVVTWGLGIGSWTLAEYVLHRWAGHVARGRNRFSREHLAHHRTEGWFSPWRSKLAIAAPVAAGLLLLSLPIAGALGAVFVVGFLSGWLGYELFHRRIHTVAPRTAWGRWAVRHHLHHHNEDPWMNHGVTSPVWDVVFRTRVPVSTVRIPRRRVPPWLLGDDGEVVPGFAPVIRLVGKA